MNRDRQTCYSRAMDKAIADVGNLGLQDYHVARTGEAAVLTEQVTDRRWHTQRNKAAGVVSGHSLTGEKLQRAAYS